MSRAKLALIALSVFVLVVVAGWMSTRSNPSYPAPTTADRAGESTCPMGTLPAEVRDTVRRIHAGGPFPFPRSDGAVFANREGHLPKQRRGYGLPPIGLSNSNGSTAGCHGTTSTRSVTGRARCSTRSAMSFAMPEYRGTLSDESHQSDPRRDSL